MPNFTTVCRTGNRPKELANFRDTFRLPKAIGNRDLSLILFKLPIHPRLSLRTFVGNVIAGIICVLYLFSAGRVSKYLFLASDSR